MKFIKELFWAIKGGSYSGKGHKFTRKGDYDRALACYKKALSYSINAGGEVILVECIARTHARLEKFDKALSEAERCFEMLKQIDSSDEVFTNTRGRVVYLIEALKNKDTLRINKILAI